MDTERPDIKGIFCTALEKKSKAERNAYLDEACGEDKKLRADVEALLKAHYEAGKSFLNGPPVDIGGTLDAPPLTEGPGTKIGRYKLLQLIGEGGFGVVYMAEQEEPIRRRVALKIIKLGMDTKQVIARFEAERQALALMEHPNIAKVLDGGATDTGRPYFVMELVKGIPITEYCDKNNLDTRQRLDLFIDVCKAVQHAHQKGIIHRDIKPSNVMITLHDGKPVPKIIDFGIAKATQHRLTEKTLFTEYRQLIGTPEYMSPEQAEMSGLDVDTRSDIYSLGVLLYELLTGTTPFEAEQLRSAAYDEIVRIIREDEPPKPSTRLNTLGDALSDVAKHRHVQPDQLCKIVRGDLDWVAMKALEKDRTRRYETANEFAGDIERHLGNEPVVAGPPSTVYRIKKFMRRNRASVTAAAVVAAAIIIGLVVSSVMYFQAEQARDKEATSRVLAEQAREKEAAARTEAVAARDEAQQAEKTAQQQQQRAERLLARSQIEFGVKLLNEGNCLGLLDLLDARSTAEEIPELRDSASRLWAIAHELWAGRLVHVLARADVLAYSPDGRLLATSSRSTTAQLWDTATGQPHGPALQLKKIIGAVVFSPDGKLLATHSVEGVSRLWDTATGQPAGPILRRDGGALKSSKKDWQLAGAKWSAAFSPDGRLLATGLLDGTVRLWETDTGRPYGQALRHEGEVWAVAFSPDGKLLGTGSKDKTARLWEVASGRPHGAPIDCGYVAMVLFSPDGTMLATNGNRTALWNTDSGELHAWLSGGWMANLAFSPDGKLLATAVSINRTAQLWDTATGQAHGEPLPHEGRVLALAFSPDGRLLATGSMNHMVRLWEVPSGKPYGSALRHQGHVRKVLFSPDGNLLAAAGDGTTRIWRPHRKIHTKVVPYPRAFELDALSPDGKVGAIISEKRVQLLDTRTFKAMGEGLRHDGEVMVVAFSPDGKLLASAGWGFIQLWDVSTRQAFGPPLKTQRIHALAFSPDGKLLAAGTDEWQACVFEVATGRRLYTLPCTERVYGVAFRPDGKVLATASWDSTARLWDMATGQQLASPLQHQARVWAVAFSPDGDLLGTVSGDKADAVQLWDLSIGPPYHSLALPPQAVGGKGLLSSIQRRTSVGRWGEAVRAKAVLSCFSSDGTVLVGRTGQRTARVWRLPVAPADLREMQLRTWVALGAQQDDQGEVTAIPWEQWQKLREELHFYEVRGPQASWPQPANGGDLGVTPDAKLKWIPGLDAVAHNVYFGADPEKLKFLGKVENSSYANLPPLERRRWYCWRVDTVKPDGSMVKGNLWSFSTGKMVGWWKFDERSSHIAKDLLGGNDGAIYGATWTSGKVDGALSFDGLDDYVRNPDSSKLPLGNSPRTMMAWINPFSYPDVSYNGILAYGAKSSTHGSLLSIRNDGRLSQAFWDNDMHQTTGPPAVLKEWNLAVFTYDGRVGKLYLNDAELVATRDFSGTTVDTWNGPITIGCTDDPGRYFNGLIDDVRIYSYALSEVEVAAIYAGEEPRLPDKPKWLVDVSSEEYAPPEPVPEKGDEYYVPLGSEADLEEKEVTLIEALEVQRRVLGEEHPDTLRSMNKLIEVYEAWGKAEKAEEWRAKLPGKEGIEESASPEEVEAEQKTESR